MVSLAIGAVLLAANWLGFTRGEIDRALDPLRDGINSLQSAHGRLDDRVSVEISRINRDKVENSTRLEMLAELNRRLEALERGLESAQEHQHIVLQQVNGLNERVEEVRRRVLAIERYADREQGYEYPPSPYPMPPREGR